MSKTDSTPNLPASQGIILKNGETWTEVRVRDFFAGIRAAMKSDDPIPIDFDDVWPWAYKHRGHAKRALERLGFKEGTDQRISLPQSGKRTKGGQNRETIMLSVKAVEHLIASKIPAVFEVYRKVFHEWFDEKETHEKLEWEKTRKEGIEVRKSVCSIYAAHGVKGREFADATNGTYQGLFRRDATQLKVDHEVPAGGNLRDHMPSMRLTVTRMAEEMTGAIVEDQDIRGGPVIADLAYDVGDDLRRACVRIRNKPRRSI